MRPGTARLRLPDPPLADGEILLAPVAGEHVAAVAAACQDPEIPRWTLVPTPYSEADARAWVALAAEEREAGTGLHFVVLDERDGRLLGAVGIEAWAWPICRVGYWVAREARGTGVATRAVRLLSRWALRTHPIPRLELIVDPANLASQRVAEKAGFTREGVMRRAWEQRGRWRDCVLFSLLPDDLTGE